MAKTAGEIFFYPFSPTILFEFRRDTFNLLGLQSVDVAILPDRGADKKSAAEAAATARCRILWSPVDRSSPIQAGSSMMETVNLASRNDLETRRRAQEDPVTGDQN